MNINQAILNQLFCMNEKLAELVAQGAAAQDYTSLLDKIIALLTELEADTSAIESTLTDIKGDTSNIVATVQDVLTQVTAINENTDEVEGLLQQLIDLAIRDTAVAVPGAAVCATVDGVDGVLVTPVALLDQYSLAHLGERYYDEMMRPITGVVTLSSDPCACAKCPDCTDSACNVTIPFAGYDTDRGLLQPGETSEFELLVDGVSQATIVHDYTTTADGVNVSTWYTPITAAINALDDWAIAVNTDVAAADQGKVIWDLTFTGTGPQELVIRKGADRLTITVDADCNIRGTSDDGTGNPFGSDPFDVTPPAPATNGFNVVAAEGQDTKINLDDPGFTDAYTDIVGAWTAADLVTVLNANAAGAVPPVVPSGIDYSTTVWQLHPTLPTVVQVASGPVPTTLDFISLNISVPFTP